MPSCIEPTDEGEALGGEVIAFAARDQSAQGV